MNKSVLIGLAAGFASSALFASAWTGTLIGIFVLFFLSPVPVAIAGLGWGWGSGAVAAGLGAFIVGVLGGFRSGVIYLAALGAPAAVFAYYTLLNRTVPAHDGIGPDEVEWYPLGRIVGWACVWAGVLATLSMMTLGGDIASVRNAMMGVFEKVFSTLSAPGGRQLSDQEKSAFVSVATILYPWAIATTWLTIATLNWWFAAKVTAHSGRLIRPWPDLASLSLPPQMPLAFAGVVVALLVTSGMPMLILLGFASAFAFGFMLVGLGVLHRITRGSVLRPLLLSAVYAALLFMQASILLVALIGLAEPYLRSRLPPPAPPSQHPMAGT